MQPVHGKHCILCCLLLACAAAGIQAQVQADLPGPAQNNTDFMEFLSTNGYNETVALVNAANMSAVLRQPAAMYTFLLPSNAALADFLKRMRLTYDDLAKERPELAKQILAQHIIPRANLREQDIFANSSSRVIGTAAASPNDLLFKKPPGGNATVTDVQGTSATLEPAMSVDRFKSVIPINKVLLPDTVFVNFPALCKFRVLTLSQFCNAVNYANLSDSIMTGKFVSTMFVPNNKAFAKALRLNDAVIPSADRTRDILLYHMVPGVHTLPRDLKNSTPTALKGQSLNVSYSVVKPATADAYRWPYTTATVVTSASAQVPVVKANVFVGKGVVHGIEEVLIPSNATMQPNTTVAAVKRAPKLSRARANTTLRRSARGSRLPSPAPEQETANTRSLLEFGWSQSAGPTAVMDATEAVIAAARGYSTAYFASIQGLQGADDLGVPGAYNQVAEGIIPW